LSLQGFVCKLVVFRHPLLHLQAQAAWWPVSSSSLYSYSLTALLPRAMSFKILSLLHPDHLYHGVYLENHRWHVDIDIISVIYVSFTAYHIYWMVWIWDFALNLNCLRRHICFFWSLMVEATIVFHATEFFIQCSSPW
jgi:hypothetical protein